MATYDDRRKKRAAFFAYHGAKGQIPLRYPARELDPDLVSDLSQTGSSYVNMSR